MSSSTSASRARYHNFTRLHPDNCPGCNGFGTTRATETVTVERAAPLYVRFIDGKSRPIALRTIKQGSACPACHGTGRLPNPSQIAAAVDHEIERLLQQSLGRSRLQQAG